MFIKNNHHNIRVKVQLMDNDDFPNSKPMNTIYDRWLHTLANDAGYTSVCLKERR